MSRRSAQPVLPLTARMLYLMDRDPRTAKDILARAGVPYSSHAHWRRGLYHPTLATMTPVFDVLGYEIVAVRKGGE